MNSLMTSEFDFPVVSSPYAASPIGEAYDCAMEIEFVEVAAQRLEVLRIRGDDSLPTLVFLHDGLGCLAQWRQVPLQLCQRLGVPGLVYSRAGNGLSTVLHAETQEVTTGLMPYMQHAWDVLPVLLRRLKIRQPYLISLGDAAIVSLLHAARYDTAGVTLMSPVWPGIMAGAALTHTTTVRASEATAQFSHWARSLHIAEQEVWRRWNQQWYEAQQHASHSMRYLTDVGVPVLALYQPRLLYSQLAYHQRPTLLSALQRCTAQEMVLAESSAVAVQTIQFDCPMSEASLQAMTRHYTDFAAGFVLA